MNRNDINFKGKLMKWNSSLNNRTMPWKEENDPYKVWLSEIILQQTRVEQGTAYYLKFIENYPTVFDLAKATEVEVLKLWEGLGYYSRARNLHFTAKHIVNKFDGVFPNTYIEILKLKGVGPYTAAAISSFVFKEKVAVVDGNVIRLLSRFFGIDKAFDSTEGIKLFKNKAKEMLDKTHPDKYNQAIMDFGATVCKPKNPLCASCIFNEDCFAFKNDSVDLLPVKKKKVKVLNRYFFAFDMTYNDKQVIEQREENDIWKKLYQLPMFEVKNFDKDTFEQSKAIFEAKFPEAKYELKFISKVFKQKLTHRLINVLFVKINLKEDVKLTKKSLYTRNLTKFAFPKVFILYFQSKSITLD